VRNLLLVFAGIVLGGSTAVAQEVDARAALEEAAEAMGIANLHTIEYSGGGFSSRIGQQYSVTVASTG
jgi:hypothetical protein